MKHKILGIITARGGSKSIPRKNIKDLGGKPLIAWTIEAAKNSGIFDRIILSTDDEEIAVISKSLGIEVPFMRPKELAEDTTPHLPVLQHAVSWLHKNENYSPEYVAILQPTAPFRNDKHLQEAWKILSEKDADSILGVQEIPIHFNPHWAYTTDKNTFLVLVNGEPLHKRIMRRQDLPPAYTHNGAIYIFKTKFLYGDEPNFYGEEVAPYIMKAEDSINIDGEEDWDEAEKRIKEI